jgi:hypothetical protein
MPGEEQLEWGMPAPASMRHMPGMVNMQRVAWQKVQPYDACPAASGARHVTHRHQLAAVPGQSCPTVPQGLLAAHTPQWVLRYGGGRGIHALAGRATTAAEAAQVDLVHGCEPVPSVQEGLTLGVGNAVP